MLKVTMMLGSFDRLLGESNMAQAIEVAKIVDDSGLYAIAIGEHVSLSSSLEGYPHAGGLRYGDQGRKPYLEPAVLHGAFAAATSRVKLSNCRDPSELIVKSHLFPERTEQGDLDWDKTFSNVPAILETGVTEFACAMPMGITAPMSLDETARFMDQLASKAKQF